MSAKMHIIICIIEEPKVHLQPNVSISDKKVEKILKVRRYIRNVPLFSK